MAGGTRGGGASAARRTPSRGSRPRRNFRVRHGRRPRASWLAADPAEPRPHPELRSLIGFRLHALGVFLTFFIDLELLLEQLPAIHLRVEAAVLEKIAMRSALDDASAVEDEYFVGILHRGDAVRDDDARSFAHHAAQAAKDLGFGVGVHRRERVIEDQDPWILRSEERRVGKEWSTRGWTCR